MIQEQETKRSFQTKQDKMMDSNSRSRGATTTTKKKEDEKARVSFWMDDGHSDTEEHTQNQEEEREGEGEGDGDGDGGDAKKRINKDEKGIEKSEKKHMKSKEGAANETASMLANSFESFEEFDLSQDILRGVYGYGFESPTPIQKIGIKPIIEARDMVIQAQAGQGKTGTFVIGSLSRIDTMDDNCQMLVLSPTRELAEQTAEVTEALSKYMDVKIRSLIGGRSARDDSDALRKNTYHIVGGTIGRVLHMLRTKALYAGRLKVLVFDEADVMLMQFNEECREVMEYVPKDVQVLLVTATATIDMLRVSKALLRNPVNILMDDIELKLGTIKQYYIDVETDEDKYSAICDLFEMFTLSQTIIFVDRRRVACDLYDRLTHDHFPTSLITGEMSQEERKEVMEGFRSGKSRVLLATNIVARGIDVQQISMVVNHSLPPNDEDYIHRVGRGGRLNRKGVALNLLNQWDRENMARIKQRYDLQIDPLPHDIESIRKNL
eukprot:m.25470 g.25470  ORF g.25470 m.25470 type:complete len:494 (+) comp5770_c0_seq1:423-1904(+)